MTRQPKKEHERFFVEEAAKHLGKTWRLGPDCEHPDFIVTEGAQRFGLEVCEIFAGRQSRAGSAMKKIESETERTVNALRRKYESKENIPLLVKFVGNLCDENMAVVLRALDEMNLSAKRVGYQDIIDADHGGAKLRVHVTRALRANWLRVEQRVGWVERKQTKHIISAAIRMKSKKLPRYRRTAGHDIRLLIVANRIHNSGKLILEERPALELRGFQVVYFFSYPECVDVFDCPSNSA